MSRLVSEVWLQRCQFSSHIFSVITFLTHHVVQMHEHRHSISIKMAAPLETCTRDEQRSLIRFLRSEGVKPIEIHRRMKVQYGDACLSQQQVYEWSRKFANGAPRPGQAQQVVTPQNIVAVEAIVMENCQVTLNDIAACLKTSHGSAC